MMKWINRLFQRFQAQYNFADEPSISGLPAGQLKALIEMIGKTQEDELSCDQIHRFLDQFADLDSQGKDASQAFPQVASHLAACSECREEFDALMRILQTSRGTVQSHE
jgi:hypothetical protein